MSLSGSGLIASLIQVTLKGCGLYIAGGEMFLNPKQSQVFDGTILFLQLVAHQISLDQEQPCPFNHGKTMLCGQDDFSCYVFALLHWVQQSK